MALFSLDDHQADGGGPGPGNDGGGSNDGGNPPTDGSNPGNDSGPRDSGTDAPIPECTGGGPRFTNARLIPGLEKAGIHQHSVRGVGDGAGVYLTSERPAEGIDLGSHVFGATRGGSGFSNPEPPPGTNINSTDFQRHAIATGDDMSMFYIQLTGTNTFGAIWRAKRSSAGAAYGTEGAVQGLSGTSYGDVYVTKTGAHMYMTKQNGSLDIFHSTPQGTGYAAPALVDGVNSPRDDYAPVVSDDLKTMYFARETGGQVRIRVAKGQSGTGFADDKEVCGLNPSNENTYPTWISPDGKTLYYVRYIGATGIRELWQAELVP
ncbi:hypothetical protein LZC95_44600 [Pendulispora brunnea]|uniref:Uncharacterized protein n=1 Tax=Pendulispora brunnea TaxID=2905690 RepID=A0ABZ2K496_9BACT